MPRLLPVCGERPRRRRCRHRDRPGAADAAGRDERSRLLPTPDEEEALRLGITLGELLARRQAEKAEQEERLIEEREAQEAERLYGGDGDALALIG